MIRFGSRTDLLVPIDSRLDVKKGDKVKGGQTVIGSLSGPTDTVEDRSSEMKDDARL
jgi:hypothetical protein